MPSSCSGTCTGEAGTNTLAFDATLCRHRDASRKPPPSDVLKSRHSWGRRNIRIINSSRLRHLLKRPCSNRSSCGSCSHRGASCWTSGVRLFRPVSVRSTAGCDAAHGRRGSQRRGAGGGGRSWHHARPSLTWRACSERFPPGGGGQWHGGAVGSFSTGLCAFVCARLGSAARFVAGRRGRQERLGVARRARTRAGADTPSWRSPNDPHCVSFLRLGALHL